MPHPLVVAVQPLLDLRTTEVSDPLTPPSPGTQPGLDRINTLSRPSLEGELHGCLSVPRWVREVADRQPYESVEALRTEADKAAHALTPPEIEEALASHPRIGERAEGYGASTSRSEQSGVDHDDRQLATALHDGNLTYEKRFGRIFLICASGLSGEEILSQLRSRLGNDAETERRVVAEELRKIALLRLDELVYSGARP